MAKKAMVLGLARSGIAATHLAVLRGLDVIACDAKTREDFHGALDQIEK